MQLIVTPPQRYAKQRSHTATHLLHAELNNIFPQAQQQGSLVESDYLRFDYNADRFLTFQEVNNIEENINDIIAHWYDIKIEEMDIQKAETLGAKMFFQEKYWDIVRVVMVDKKNKDNQIFSIELCWGTHVSNTKEIGIFKITWQESIANGIKRITAYTWPQVIKYIRDKENILSEINALCATNTHQLVDRITKLQEWSKELRSKLDKAYQLWFNDNRDNVINISKVPLLADTPTKEMIAYIKNIKQDLIIYDDEGSFIIHSPFGNAKEIGKGLKWWGNNNMFQWKDMGIKDITIL